MATDKRPGAVVAAGIAMLAFGLLIAFRLTAWWTTFIPIGHRPLDDYLMILGIEWEPTLAAIAGSVLLLAVFVLRGRYRARFAALAVMGALLIEEALALISAIFEAATFYRDNDIYPLIFFVNAIHVVGLGLAVAAVVLLSTAKSARWSDQRQLTGAPPAKTESRPRSLLVAIVALTVIALFAALDYVGSVVTATGDEYLSRTEHLVARSLDSLLPLILLVVAIVGLCFGSGLARLAAYPATGCYGHEAATEVLRVARRLSIVEIGELADAAILLIWLPLGALAVGALVALSRPQVVAWFQARRNDASSTAAD